MSETLPEIDLISDFPPAGALAGTDQAIVEQGDGLARRVTLEALAAFIAPLSVQSLFETATEFVAASIPANVDCVETRGDATVGDFGGAIWVRAVSQAAAGPGAKRSADRFLPGGLTSSSNGGWWRLASWELTPEMVGARPGIDCTDLFRLLGQIIQFRGGGILKAKGAGVYDIWPSGTPTGYDALMVLSGVPFIVDMGEATVRSTRDWYAGAASSARAVIVSATNCTGEVVMKTLQTVRDASNFLRGLVPLAIVDACKNVKAKLDMVGGNFGVWVARGIGWAGDFAEGIEVDITCEDVFYPLAGSENGRDIRGIVRARGAGRSVLLAGCRDVYLTVVTNNAGEYGDIKIVTYLDASDADSRTTDNINIRVVHRTRGAGTVPLSSLVSCEYQFRSGAPVNVVGRMNNVRIHIDADYGQAPQLTPNAIVEAMVGTAGGTIAPAALECIGFRVTGSVLGINRQGPVIVDFFTRGAEAFGLGSVVAGCEFAKIDRGTGGADFQVGWLINCAVLTSPLRLTDIHAPRDVLTLQNYAPGRVWSQNAGFAQGHARDLIGRPQTYRLPDGTQAAPLEAIASGFFPALFRRADASANGSALRLEKARGTPDAPAAPAANDYAGTLITVVWDGSTWNTAARLQSRVMRFGGVNDFDVGWELETRVGGTRTVTLHASPQGQYGFGGVASPTCTVDVTGQIRTRGVTVAALPAAATAGAGARAHVTDANATTFASIVAGGGSNGVPVYSDGTNWRIG